MKEVCAVFDVRRIDEIILMVQNKMWEVSKLKLNHIYYSAPYKFKKEIEQLTVYLPLLDRQRRQLVRKLMPCLSDYDMQCLYEKIVKITGSSCYNLKPNIWIDSSNEEIWALKNPACRSYKEWEKASKTLCDNINLDIKIETMRCDIAFDITKEIINCDVLLAISAYYEANRLNMEITRSQEQCELDFYLLLEKIPSCDLDLNMYMKLINNNLSFDIIHTIYQSGLRLDTTHEKVQLKTPVSAYPLAEISGDIDVAYLKKLGMTPTKTKSQLLQDYK